MVPPGRKLDERGEWGRAGRELVDYTLPKDLQPTHGKYSSCQILIPPGRSFYDRDVKPDLMYHTQWELIYGPTSAKDLKDTGRPAPHSSLEFVLPHAAVTSPRKNITMPASHVSLRRSVETMRSWEEGMPPLPPPESARAAPPDAAVPGIPVTMAEVMMLRDGRGPRSTQALAPSLVTAVQSARLLKENPGLPEGERTSRMRALSLACNSPTQRSSVSRAVGSVRGAVNVLSNSLKATVDTSKYLSALHDARAGSLMAAVGGTPAALRRSLRARLETAGGGGTRARE